MVENVFGTGNLNAVGQTVDVLFDDRYYTYTIVGVYEYEESDFSSSSSEDTETTVYLPLQAARNQTHNNDGYSQLTVLTTSGTDAVSFCTTLEEYMNNRYYKNNESFEVSTMSLESVIESMTEMLSTVSLAIAAVAANMMGYAVSPSIDGIILSVSFSVFIGVFFGYYPANKAARLNPIEALRYE